MKVYGKIVKTLPKERIIKVLGQNKIHYLYMSRKFFKDFGPYFYYNPYVFVNVSAEKKQFGDYHCQEIDSFNKIVQSTKREKIVYYNLDAIKKGVRNLLLNTKNKMFLDLEYSLPPYYQTFNHVAEIVQYGIVIEDENGNIVFEDGALVKPQKKYALNRRTLKFINRKAEDSDNACTYGEFYNLIKWCIAKYDVKIIAWGRNDILALENSFKINRINDLDIRNRYVNFMQVIKNYYNIKTDLGLFNTYQEISGVVMEPQKHDALEDAMLVREIYRIFKEKVLSE
jgi:sporulation inhibitor KapD